MASSPVTGFAQFQVFIGHQEFFKEKIMLYNLEGTILSIRDLINDENYQFDLAKFSFTHEIIIEGVAVNVTSGLAMTSFSVC